MSRHVTWRLRWSRSALAIGALLAGTSIYGLKHRKIPLRNDSQTALPEQKIAIKARQGKASSNINNNSFLSNNYARDSAEQDRTVDHESDVPLSDDIEGAAWAAFSNHFATARESLSSIQWPSLGDRITDLMVPEWVQDLPHQVNKLQAQLSMAPGSLADEIWQEAKDPEVNPEITYEAKVRFGKSLCKAELEFRERRKRHTAKALAKYLAIPEKDVEPDDVPIIAMCGSGGGLRALVSGAASYLSTQEAGLFDCVTYTAGVSGSCWLQALFYSTVGGQRHDQILNHLKKRIHTHIAFPPVALGLFIQAPTNKFLLSGCVEKLKGDPTADFGLVDVYGLLLAARLLVPRGDLSVNSLDLKISNQRAYLTRGEHPLPLYSAVRHEIPVNSRDRTTGQVTESIKEQAKKEAWFQWFEFSPYELWCEEIAAGIPSYAIGRKFKNGLSTPHSDGVNQPETQIRPLVKNFVGFGGIDDLVEEKNDELVKVHPIDPATIPNYAIGVDEAQLSPTTPKSIFAAEHLQLMDAGMSNNLPIYPLLREGRNVDVFIAFDASADIKTENWLSVADGYAKQRGIKGWPLGAGWPKEKASEDATKTNLDAAETVNAQQAAGKLAETREEQRARSEAKQGKEADLNYCNVWVGTTLERESAHEPPQSKRLDPDAEWKISAPDAGITVIYLPFLPNPTVEGVDPNTSDFMSTWNFIYTPEAIEKVVRLARANFQEGSEQTKRTIRAVYERKKSKRLEAESRDRIRRWKRQLRDSGDHFG
ncbi:MAG: hypothetical protein Q9191_000199 [Dirinaria sp. TL-2023a]